MLISLVGNVMLSLLRTIFYLVAKRPVGRARRVGGGARRRRPSAQAGATPGGAAPAGRRAAYSRLRGDLPPGRSIRRVAEFAATVLSRPAPEDLAGAHHATDDPTDDDSLLVDTGFLQRLLTRPGVLLVLGLIVITAVAASAR